MARRSWSAWRETDHVGDVVGGVPSDYVQRHTSARVRPLYDAVTQPHDYTYGSSRRALRPRVDTAAQSGHC